MIDNSYYVVLTIIYSKNIINVSKTKKAVLNK